MRIGEPCHAGIFPHDGIDEWIIGSIVMERYYISFDATDHEFENK